MGEVFLEGLVVVGAEGYRIRLLSIFINRRMDVGNEEWFWSVGEYLTGNVLLTVRLSELNF